MFKLRGLSETSVIIVLQWSYHQHLNSERPNMSHQHLFFRAAPSHSTLQLWLWTIKSSDHCLCVCVCLHVSLSVLLLLLLLCPRPARRKPGTGTAATWRRWWWAASSAQGTRCRWVSANITKLSTARKLQRGFQQESSALRVSGRQQVASD